MQPYTEAVKKPRIRTKALPPVALPDWRGQAREMLPELEPEIEEAENPMALWLDIWFSFTKAYEAPIADDRIRRIFAYARWSAEQPKIPNTGLDGDLFTCVVVCFYEHITQNPAARKDMPRWFSRTQLAEWEQAFRYHCSEPEWEELLALYDPRPRSRPHRPAKDKKRG